MATNHTHSSLDLSALNSDVEYTLPLDITAKRCLIHVKLTESCSKVIDNLISSNKGAVFSLWFTENGGHLRLPSSNGAHTFQFSTAVPNKREQESTLECFHQLTSQDRQQQLSMFGRLEHKLTVKATEDVYEETKKKAKLLEEERQGVRAKEIRIPKVKPKHGGNNRINHKAPFDTSLGRASFTPSSSGRGGSGTVGGANNKLPHVGGTGRAQQKSLKERVIHILALKPCRRTDVVSKLKKATKKSESFFSNLDSVLSEVAYLQESTYHLKDSFYSQLDVESWPFYSEAERDLVKRKLSRISTITSTDTPPSGATALINSMPSILTAKHLADDSVTNNHAPPSKKPRTDPINNNSSASITQVQPVHNSRQPKPLTENVTSNELRSQQRSTADTKTDSTNNDRSILVSKFLSNRYIKEDSSSHKVPNTDTPNPEVMKRKPQHIPIAQTDTLSKLETGMKDEVDGNEGAEPDGGHENNHKHKKKKKKKHKKDGKDTESINVSLSSQTTVNTTQTTEYNHNTIISDGTDKAPYDNNDSNNNSLPDFESLYPIIASSQQRANYKSLFNNEYKDYLLLKDKMDNIQAEVSLLSDQLESLPHNSPAVKEVKHKIRRKYIEMQQDTTYQEEKKRLFYLHYKLDHIKKMVIMYDRQQS